jgi:hypothetical protein
MTQRLEKQTDDLVADASASSEPTIEPTQAEIDEWARRERERRQEWLQGPTVEEREAYASRLRQRRLSETFEEGEARVAESLRLGVHYGRETQLAAEGALALLYRFSRRTFAELVQAGREWEEETSLPPRRRRVSIDDESS